MTEKIKTTAPVLSVGADREQPNTKNHKEIIANETAQINLQAAQNPEKSRSGGLQIVSMTELYDTVYPPRTPVVDGFLYGGTYLFVGAPKVGKSFFMGQLAYHVAMGLPLWDYPVRKGTVLYLALEDDYARLQRRLSGMFGVECADNLYFATQAKTLNEGLDRQLEEFLKEHTDARLIIIDTLQKVREVGGDRYSYSSDYEIVTKLKSFSDKYGICLLVVHHTRKLESEDSFDMISGTNAVFIVTIFVVLLLITTVFKYVMSNFRIANINLGDKASISKKEEKESIFDKSLDEIVYFFESTTYDTVFIEDLDRFNQPNIFIKLRELNTVINNYDNIKRKVVFIYAIKDDMFKDEERTKFFDFIVPVIPYINATNSGEILRGLLKFEKGADDVYKSKNYDISDRYIWKISPFVQDMRV